MAAPARLQHGLTVWGEEPAPVPAELQRDFVSIPANVDAARAWVAASPSSHLLTAILGPPVSWDMALIGTLAGLARTAFVIVWAPDATENPQARIAAFEAGARMVTNEPEDLAAALRLIVSVTGDGLAAAAQEAAGAAAAAVQQLQLQPQPQGAQHGHEEQEAAAAGAGALARGRGTAARQYGVTCPWCGLAGLGPGELWRHQPLYHIYEPDILSAPCPVCRAATSRLTTHISTRHGPAPPGVDERTGVFALAVVRRASDGHFLLVQERYGEGYWVPGGGVDPGEGLRAAAVRETREEGGADIVITGILAIESGHRGAWRRVIFAAQPAEDVEAAAAEAAAGAAGAGAAAQDSTAAAAAAAAAAAPTVPPRRRRRRYACKTLPDVESAGACWVAGGEVAALPLRSASEPLTWIPWVAAGGAVLPLDPALPDLRRVFPDYAL